MKRLVHYTTKQSEAILAYIMSLEGEHITVNQIAAYFANQQAPISVATIYRHLDRLVENGTVRKYTLDGFSSACYQYISNEKNCHEIHLKCESCGTLLHVTCGMLERVPKHVYQEHDFQINPMKIVFYGKCSKCMD